MQLQAIKAMAEQGNAEAQYDLGEMYRHGAGVRTDYVRAYVWYDLAAVSGHKKAGELQDLMAKLMTPEQIAEAQQLARAWMEKHRKE